MILVINEKESATLVLHMAIMRKNYRKLIKSRYKARRGELNNSYDYLLDSVKEALKSENKENEIYIDDVDKEVLCAFLSSYIEKLEELELKEEMIEQSQVMKALHLRCQELVAV